MKYYFFIFLLTGTLGVSANAQQKADAIAGKWMNTENNLEVEVFRQHSEYKARLLWFDDSDDKTKPTATRLDEKNHDKTLRNRKLVGIEVLHGLLYNIKDDEWQDGIIYDSSSGKNWDAKAWINTAGILKQQVY
jgi:uncharacterized protein (DUF2147 family)